MEVLTMKYLLNAYGIDKTEVNKETAIEFLTDKQIQKLETLENDSMFLGTKVFKITCKDDMNIVYNQVIVKSI
jgi:hypothetical protein